MLNSKTILESRLHEHLTERKSSHIELPLILLDLNSEIARGTIKDHKTAQDWLKK
jgi:hypothetical protein